MLPASFLLGLSLLLLVGRWYQPWAARPPGAIVARFRVPLRAKVRLQRANVYALAALLLLGSVGGWVPPLLELGVVVVAMGLLSLPVRYTLTDQAIALGRTPPRRWAEYASLEALPGRVILRPRSGARGYPVWLPGTVASGPLIALMERSIARAAEPPPVQGRRSRKTHGVRAGVRRTLPEGQE